MRIKVLHLRKEMQNNQGKFSCYPDSDQLTFWSFLLLIFETPIKKINLLKGDKYYFYRIKKQKQLRAEI